VPNAERLTAALEDVARRRDPGHAAGPLPPDVRVQFAKLGTVPAALLARLTALGVEVVA
jgi:hypothetical protein